MRHADQPRHTRRAGLSLAGPRSHVNVCAVDATRMMRDEELLDYRSNPPFAVHAQHCAASVRLNDIGQSGGSSAGCLLVVSAVVLPAKASNEHAIGGIVSRCEAPRSTKYAVQRRVFTF